jgi:hypothetical protein
MLVLIVVTSILFGMNPEKIVWKGGYPFDPEKNSFMCSPDEPTPVNVLLATEEQSAKDSSDLRAGQLTQTAPHATDTSVEQGK